MRAALRRRPFERGQSAVEMSMLATVLVLILLACTDFARLYYTAIELQGAARAGAQYGSQGSAYADDSNNVCVEAYDDAQNIWGGSTAPTQCADTHVPNMSVSTSQCTCQTVSPQTPPLCPSSECTNLPNGTFVSVTATSTYHTLVDYPGIPSTIPLSSSAILPVSANDSYSP